MALNEINRDGDSVPMDVASTINSGDLVVFASGAVGVAETDAVERENGVYKATIRFKGVFGFAFTGALAAGTALYATTTPSTGLGTLGVLTATPSTNPKVGTVHRTKASGAGTVYINLDK